MRLAIMQPYLFPYIGYFQMIKASDKFVMYDDVQFIQRGWINRNYILSKEGRTLFTIPVKKAKIDTQICEIEIANSKWKEKFLNGINMTYKRAPFFESGIQIIENAIDINSDKIADYAINSAKAISEYLDIQTHLFISSEIEYDRESDKKQKINSIISVMNANEFILPPGSTELYDKNDFAVKTKFIIPDQNITYRQFSKTRFESNLSIIDVIMFNNKEEVVKLLKKFYFQ